MEAQRTVRNISSSSSLLISMVTIECQWNVSDRERVLLGGHYQLVHPMLLQGRAQLAGVLLRSVLLTFKTLPTAPELPLFIF